MRTKFVNVIGLLVFVCAFLASSEVLAVGSGAVPVRRVFSAAGGPVTPWSYSELIASTVKGMNGVQVNNTGLNPVMLAFGPVGGEVAQVLVGGREDTGFLPVMGGYATRLSVVSLDSPNETGELDVNVFYN